MISKPSVLTAQGIVALRQSGATGSPARDFIERCHARAQDWTAGLILLLTQESLDKMQPSRPTEAGPRLLFDYFAREIFSGFSDAAKAILLKTWFFPK